MIRATGLCGTKRGKKVEYDILSFVWELMRLIEMGRDVKIDIQIEMKIEIEIARGERGRQ